MKILVYGSDGWIGRQFVDILKSNNANYVCGEVRVENINKLKKEIEDVTPTHIISFIGRTHGKIGNTTYSTIDYLEQDGKIYENVRDNLFSPIVLALLCKERGIHYTYLGTGCIFKFDDLHPFGEETAGFLESSLPNFFGSSYSVVKGFTDQLMHFFEDNVLNLRIRMPITGLQNPRNFITKITTYNKICSVPNSMSVLSELLPKVLDMMKKEVTGTLNLTNPGLISHNEILEMFRDIVDPTFKWDNFTEEEQRRVLESDRSNNYLDTTRLEKMYPDVKNIKESVRDMLYQYKSSYVPVERNKTVENKANNNGFFDSKDILTLFITGGYGFIGSNFINYFCSRYPHVKVINLDAMYYCANLENVSEQIRKSELYESIEGNLQNFDLLRHIFKNNNITHVIHFAARSHVQSSFNDSLSYTNDNIVGTHNLLEAARLYCKSLKCFIHVSTDEVYGESMLKTDEQQKTEQCVLCPTNPYASTKAAAELIAQSYNHSFRMPIIITRGNNVYGRNQYPEKLIPRFIKLLNENKPVTIQGDGSNMRSFIHVNDTVRAFETILFKGRVGEIYNIGSDERMEFSVLDIAKLLIKNIKHTEEYDKWITYVEDRPFNDKRYYISNKKLKDLGWEIGIKDIETHLLG